MVPRDGGRRPFSVGLRLPRFNQRRQEISQATGKACAAKGVGPSVKTRPKPSSLVSAKACRGKVAVCQRGENTVS